MKRELGRAKLMGTLARPEHGVKDSMPRRYQASQRPAKQQVVAQAKPKKHGGHKVSKSNISKPMPAGYAAPRKQKKKGGCVVM